MHGNHKESRPHTTIKRSRGYISESVELPLGTRKTGEPSGHAINWPHGEPKSGVVRHEEKRVGVPEQPAGVVPRWAASATASALVPVPVPVLVSGTRYPRCGARRRATFFGMRHSGDIFFGMQIFFGISALSALFFVL